MARSKRQKRKEPRLPNWPEQSPSCREWLLLNLLASRSGKPHLSGMRWLPDSGPHLLQLASNLSKLDSCGVSRRIYGSCINKLLDRQRVRRAHILERMFRSLIKTAVYANEFIRT